MPAPQPNVPESAALSRYAFEGLRYHRRPAQTASVASTLHFTHATGFHGFTYRPLIERIPADVDVHAVDLRGHGGSRDLGDLEAFEAWDVYVDDLVRWLDAQPAPAILAGHSVGGTVSLLASAQRPEKVSGLLLLEPVIVPGWAAMIIRMLRALRVPFETPLAVGAARRKARFESHGAAMARYEGRGAFATWPREFLAAYVAEGFVPATEGDGVELACAPAWESRSFSLTPIRPLRGLSPLPFPTTVLAGAEKGSTCSPSAQRALRRTLRDVRVVRAEGATHFLPMEQPERVLEELVALRERIAKARGDAAPTQR